jgi:hypothetical protein
MIGSEETGGRASDEEAAMSKLAGAEGSVQWPMSNEELRAWFSRDSISIEELAQMWIHMDQNEETNREIREYLDRRQFNILEKRLRKRIQFGTAGNLYRSHLMTGLRGRMEAGFSRMNNLTVIQASQVFRNSVFV